MKYKYLKNLLVILLFTSFSITGQTPQEKKDIIREYDISKLEHLREKFEKKFSQEKNRAILLATQRGWKITYTDSEGSYHELMKISKEGKPLYYKTNNADAAISTRANFMHNNGGLGLNIEGQGMTAHVWDAGLARSTHQEYDGIGGEDRFSIGDGTTELHFHSAHVMGTIIASGFEAQAKGMAPQAKGIGYDWDDHLAEATEAAANGMLVSNHSYGYGAEEIPDYFFGAYIEESKDWDNLMYNAPYYLMVAAAGNDGNDNTSNAEPLEGNSAFDKISAFQAAKNNLVIANGQDATINADGTLASVNRNTGSSEGPMDDLRIKPDLMGNGSGLYSSYHQADDAYNTISGTSMASPNVAGSLLLLQQHYKESYGGFMRAATLKGLALHTADDTDITGPDPHAGWGLMNTKVAAETITKNGFESWISEEILTNGSTYTAIVKSDGFNPLLASISWTDKPGVVSGGTVNDPKAALVNDLDIRVTKSTNEYKPWKLTGVYSNEKGDNLVDPFERVDVENPTAGEYTITVTHKGTLAEDQRFSLVITGISGEFNFITANSEKRVCSDSEAVFNFEYRQAAAGTTQFTTTGAPEGMTTTFSEQFLSANGNFTVTFGNLVNVPAGPYNIEITGNNGNETKKRTIRVVVYHPDFSNNPSELEYPANGQKGISKKVSLLWKNNLNAENYKVEVSDSPSFNNIIFTDVVLSKTVDIDLLLPNTIYYWRIKPKNSCGEGDFSSIFSFQTGISDCTNTYTATDFSMASINPFLDTEVAIVPISVTDNLIINKVTVNIDVSHTRVKDLTILLETPTAIGANRVVLLANACDDTANISNTTFDDEANALVCNAAAPAISGTIKPMNNMSATSLGKNAIGEWKLIVVDDVKSNGGQINSVSITICASVANTNIPSFTSSVIKLDANSTYTISTANMEATTASETAEQQIFTLVEQPKKGQLQKEGTTLNAGDTFTQADITANKITFVNVQTASFADQFKVDVTNAAKGWLGNQMITIEEKTLTIDEFSLDNVSFWPNPAKDILNVKLNNATSENILITLFDLQGRKVISSVNKTSNTIFTKEIDTKNVSSGVYLLSIQQGNKKATKKIIVTK